MMGPAIAIALFATTAPAGTANAEQGDETKAAPTPVRVDRERLAGLALTEWEPMTKQEVPEGSRKHRGHVFFAGELVVEVWEAGPAKLAIAEPFPYDEYVRVLSGKLVLTDEVGGRNEYVEGDDFVIPKGFKGAWHMFGNYRELVVIERKAYEAVEGPVAETPTK